MSVSTPFAHELLDLAAPIARQAADLLLDGLYSNRTAVATKSSTTDMVTEMDRASEALIVEKLLQARPDDGVVGEEGSSRDGSSGVRWVIDPIDGTTNYIYGHPGWSVSIAAEADVGGDGADQVGAASDGADGHVRREVVAAVVLDAMHDETFTAVQGSGAWCNGDPIRCSQQTDMSRALVATGFAYSAERRRGQAEVLVGVLPEIRDIRRMGAASVDLCWVGCGRVDAYFEKGLAWWDFAAGSLVATEAGARVTSLSGGPISGRPAPGSILAAAPAIADPLRMLLDSFGAEKVP